MESLTTNPWLSMWTKPRATIQQIIDANPRYLVMLLTSLWGLDYALSQASFKGVLSAHMDFTSILALALIVGPIGGVLSLYLYAWLLRWTGRWIGGKASAVQIRAAFAWSTVPVIWSMLLWIPEMLIMGQSVFAKDLPVDISPMATIIVGVIAVAKMVLGFWSGIVYLKALGQVQGFSAWRALANNFYVVLVFYIPIAIILLVIAEMYR